MFTSGQDCHTTQPPRIPYRTCRSIGRARLPDSVDLRECAIASFGLLSWLTLAFSRAVFRVAEQRVDRLLRFVFVVLVCFLKIAVDPTGDFFRSKLTESQSVEEVGFTRHISNA